MSKAAELAALIGSQTALSNRNLIINGSQIIAQRATSATAKTASGYYTCDRWQQLISSAGTWTFTQDTSVPSGEGFAYSYKWDCTTADGSLASGDYLIHRQNIEGQNLQQLSYGVSGAKSVTLSFWVKSNKTGTYVCELRKGDDSKHIGRTYAISSANTWEYKTVTFTGDTASALVNTNATGIKVHFWLAAGSSYTSGTLPASWASNTAANQAVGQTVNLADSTSNEWLITGVQLEIGEQATAFEHRSFGDELSACQRYYQVIGNGAGRAYDATKAETYQQTQVPLRATNFSLSLNSGVQGHISGVDGYTLTNVELSQHSTSNFVARVTTSGNWNSYIGTVVGFLGSTFICDSEL